MSLRFFSDQCVPAEITDTLRQHGHQVTLVREVLPIRSLDPAVIAAAQELGAVLVSLNGDFADIVAYPPANYFGTLNAFEPQCTFWAPAYCRFCLAERGHDGSRGLKPA